jgi:hypothetical protein
LLAIPLPPLLDDNVVDKSPYLEFLGELKWTF